MLDGSIGTVDRHQAARQVNDLPTLVGFALWARLASHTARLGRQRAYGSGFVDNSTHIDAMAEERLMAKRTP